MFRKLHLELTLINTAIILALFLVLSIGTYYFLQIDMDRRAGFALNKIAADIRAGLVTDLPQRSPLPPPGEAARGPRPGLPSGPPPGPHLFFVKTSPAGDITFASSSQPFAAHDQLALLTDKVLNTDATLGTLIHDETAYAYLKAPLDRQQGSVIVFHDTSQEKNMLRGLLTALTAVGIICALLSFGLSFFLARRAIVPIRQAWQQQRDFIADASHELRTPLAVIQANLEVVLDSCEETVGSQSKWLENIREEVQQTGALVDSLLFLARADSQSQAPAVRPFSLTTASLRAVDLYEPIAAAKGIALEVAAEVALTGYGDETHIKKVIAILLDNAIRHTGQGGRISIRLAASGKQTVVTVADTGEGIPPEHLAKIFDRFYQVDKARTKGGAGLGLAIAKWIVESHGGVIKVESAPGKGTTFSLIFPWRQTIAENEE